MVGRLGRTGPGSYEVMFELPLEFSRAAAELPRSGSNPGSGRFYPAFINGMFTVIIDPGTGSPVIVIISQHGQMTCLNIGWFGSRPWWVHWTWITIRPRRAML